MSALPNTYHQPAMGSMYCSDPKCASCAELRKVEQQQAKNIPIVTPPKPSL
ncbi:MAG TPA: hypothetical protein VGF44_09865 [Terriglobales bacterium]